MTFGSTFGRVFSPTFQPKSIAPAVAGGWWLSGGIAAANCVAAYQAKGAASYAASLVNLANAGTYDATGYNTPTWSASVGWTLGGYSPFSYIRIGVLIQTGWSIVGQFGTCAGGGFRIFGVTETGGIQKHAAFNFVGGKILWPAGYGTDTTSATSGNLAIIGNKCYLNGTLDATGTDAYSASAQGIQIGGYNKNGTADGFSTGAYGRSQSFAIYNTAITEAQLAALITAMAAL